jgi:indolepyruvate ferredoxin oxidoreductase
LARLKFLRGTRFDPLGYATERRKERALITWYEQLVDEILARLNAANLAELTSLAEAAMDIRGYGPVKDKAIADVQADVDRRLARASTARAA